VKRLASVASVSYALPFGAQFSSPVHQGPPDRDSAFPLPSGRTRLNNVAKRSIPRSVFTTIQRPLPSMTSAVLADSGTFGQGLARLHYGFHVCLFGTEAQQRAG